MIWEKQEEEAELRSYQVGREVVQRWLETTESLTAVLLHGSDNGGPMIG